MQGAPHLLPHALARERVLVEHARRAQHGQAAVLKLLQLQLVQLLLVLGAQVRGVPANVAGAAALALDGRVEHLGECRRGWVKKRGVRRGLEGGYGSA